MIRTSVSLATLILAGAVLTGCAKPEAEVTAAQPAKAASTVPAFDASKLELPYEMFTLDNGLRVIVHEDRKTPTVAVSVWYHVGSKDEKPGRTGFAHLFEHLMFNGSENYPDEYFKPFELAGATGMNGTTWFDRTNYFQTVPTNALDMALWMESDRMGHLLGVVDQKVLDEQRGVVQNEKRQGQNQPYGKVWDTFLPRIFPEGHPYSWSTIGSMEDLNAASLEDVHSWFKEYYGASNTVLVLAGDIDVETAKEKAQKYFGDIAAGEPLTRRKSWIAKREDSSRDVMYDRVAQSRIYKIWNTPGLGHADTNAMGLAASVLGSGKNSRLYKRLVYKDQIATSVYVAPYSFELATIFQVVADAKPGVDLAKVEQAIEEELQTFLKEGPTEEELARVKAKEYAGFARGLETIGGFSGKATKLAQGLLYEGDPNAKLKNLQARAGMGVAEVKTAANKWLSSGDYSLEVHPFEKYSVASEGADRSKLPDVGEFPSVKFPELQTAELDNGLKVILAERQGAPVVQMNMIFDAGYAADQGGKLGTASYAMSMLKEGAGGLSALEISEQQELLGAGISATANLDVSMVGLSALVDQLAPSLDLYAKVIRNPAFDDEEIERKRSRWLASIEQEKTQPVSMALRSLPPLLYGKDHAYGVPFTGSGTPDAIKALNREDLVNYHSTWMRPDNATLVVAGAIGMDALKAKLNGVFGDWAAPEMPLPSKNVAKVDLAEKASVYIIDKPGSEQSLIIGGVLSPEGSHPESTAIGMMNDILGGTFTARVNMNLREDKHWAYGAYTFMQGARGQQPFMVYAPVQSDKTMESLAELQKELRDYIGSRPAEADELSKIKSKKVNELPGKFETVASVENQVSAMVRYGRSLDYMQGYAERVSGIELERVRELANEVVKPDQITWVIVGDKASIESGIASLSIGPIAELDVEGNLIDGTQVASDE